MCHTSSNSLKMQKTTNEEYGQYGLSLLGLAPRTKKLSVDDQAALSPTSIHTTDFSAGSSESQAPSFAEPPPPSEKSAEGSEDSETIRGTSCAKHIPGSYNPSALDDAIISDAELVSSVHDIFPAELANNARMDTNSNTTRSARPLFRKAGLTIPKILSLSIPRFPPTNMILENFQYQFWLPKGMSTLVATCLRSSEVFISGFQPPMSSST